MDNENNDYDASSSSSDDDYLTLNDSTRDRESLVRKKLLENFYGRSAVAAASRPTAENDEHDSDDDDALDDSFLTRPSAADRDNLDSPAFDAKAHTNRHVLHSNVHHLLEVEERLALQVRTLDSTMQTLVYENYSRFIDATDAIRSIGVNVQANEAGLKRLSERIKAVDKNSKETEEALGTLRDQVAEKIRVKRLLSRLDALLKLPQTLREQISLGKYRTATKSYISASSILSKHSEGFESLKNIETECTEILVDLKRLLNRKILHWNGRLPTTSDDNTTFDENNNLPEPPKTMTEIFECVGTLEILMDDQTITGLKASLKEEGEEEAAEDGKQEDGESEVLYKDELQSLAIGAATRALDRVLDTHMIQVQERRFAPLGEDAGASASALDIRLGGATSGNNETGLDGAPLATPQAQPQGAALVPRDYLDAILEVSTLYGLSFGNVDLLADFISEAFSSFLSHVRGVLLEESENAQLADNDDGLLMEDEEGVEGDEASGEEEISSALALLVQAVREMASGLSLPEVGVNPDFTSKLVDEAMRLTDSMVTRRVHQKFNDLRVSIVKDCLLPFSEKLAEHRSNTKGSGSLDKETMSVTRQIASSTLSDCLQLVDDTIRSIIAGTGSTEAEGAVGNGNLPTVVKDAVQASIKEFTDWLAGALELLAGGEASTPNLVVEVPLSGENDDRDVDGKGSGATTTEPSMYSPNDIGDIKDSVNILELIESARKVLCGEDTVTGDAHDENEFVIAIAEMCRLAQGSVSENLQQSISTHLGTGKRKSRHMFAGENQRDPSKQSEEDEVSLRFRLAASRIFALHASQKGAESAALLVLDLEKLGEDTVECSGPRENTFSALAVVKSLCLECAEIFDDPRRAGPVPELDSGPIGGLSSAMGLGIKTSLQIDVERMFKEKVAVLQHPSEQLDFSRSALVFVMMKVGIRAFLEVIRLCSFSAAGYKQLQVDVEFLKLMVPHYINEDFAVNGNNACSSITNMLSEVMDAVGERCLDEECENDEHLQHESISILRLYMAGIDEKDEMGSRFIIAE